MSTIAPSLQEELNRAVYSDPGVIRFYLSHDLRPAEAACLETFKSHIAGRDVLDIGVGCGRTTRYLAPLARRYAAIDYSPVMVSYIRKIMPEIAVEPADFSDLSLFDNASFDFVFATDNVIDALSHQSRQGALAESRRVLRAGGLLAFSSHNLCYKHALSAPWLDWSSNPRRMARNLAKFALSWWNQLRVRRLRTATPEYALLNDRGHFYSCLHYYATRSTVRAQLENAGFRLLAVFATDGRGLQEFAPDEDYPSLLYVAEARN